MTVDLSGKTAIVTGASKGIGYGIAEAIARSGGNVAICSRDEGEVRGAAERLTAAGGGRVVGFPCDMRNHEDVRRLVRSTVDSFGGIDVLVNNAGVGGFAPMGDLSPDVWHQIIETNLNGVYYACHEVIPRMIDRGQGWIINIGSLAGKNPFPGGAAYNASKFGLLGFSEAMMLDVRHRGIRVSCIMPGSVQSHFEGPNAHRGPNEWKLQPEDIAEMVLDLLSFHSRALPSRVEMRPSKPPK